MHEINKMGLSKLSHELFFIPFLLYSVLMVFFVLHLFSNSELVQNNTKHRSLETVKSSTIIQPEEPQYNEKLQYLHRIPNLPHSIPISTAGCLILSQPSPLHSMKLFHLRGIVSCMSPTFPIDSLTDHFPAPSFQTYNHSHCICFTISVPSFIKSFLVGMPPLPNYLKSRSMALWKNNIS